MYEKETEDEYKKGEHVEQDEIFSVHIWKRYFQFVYERETEVKRCFRFVEQEE